MNDPSVSSSLWFYGGICLLIAPVPVHCFSTTFHINLTLTVAMVAENGRQYRLK